MKLQKIGTLYKGQISAGISSHCLPLLSLLTDHAQFTTPQLPGMDTAFKNTSLPTGQVAITQFTNHSELSDLTHNLLSPTQIREQLTSLIVSQTVHHTRDRRKHQVELGRYHLRGERIKLVRPILRGRRLNSGRDLVIFSLLLDRASRNRRTRSGAFLVNGNDLEYICATCNYTARSVNHSLQNLQRLKLISIQNAHQDQDGSTPADRSVDLSALSISFATGMEHSFRALAVK